MYRFLPWMMLLWVGTFKAASYGQSPAFQRIEKQVYRYNNALQYKQSQALLLPILSSSRYSPDEQYQAAILLSYTYKRVLDYATTLQFLDKAAGLASATTRPAADLARVRAQKAFVYFDTHRYDRADSLMQALARSRFSHISQEDKAKLVHQQGYLLFLAGNYPAAESTYDRALTDLQVASPCDVPMILVKKMELYAAMNRMDQALAAFEQSNRRADSCGIIKYRIYAYGELGRIYKARRDAAGLAAVTTQLDSMNLLYDQSQHIASLHEQKEGILQRAGERRRNQLQAVLGVLGGVTTVLLGGLLLYRRRQRQLLAALEQMRAELRQYAASTQASSLASSPDQPVSLLSSELGKLSGRQQQVLTHLAHGLSNREIAELLCVSENTIKYHIKNIYEELNISSRRELLTRLKK